jgi:hypothetical protein
MTQATNIYGQQVDHIDPMSAAEKAGYRVDSIRTRADGYGHLRTTYYVILPGTHKHAFSLGGFETSSMAWQAAAQHFAHAR